jgi:hypothetical protein
MNPVEFPWLTAIIALPLVASLAIPIIPDKEGKTVRWYGLGVAIADFALMIYAFWQHYDFQNSTYQFVEKYAWIPQIGLNWSVAVDGLSMPLILLTGLINTLAIFSPCKVTNNPRLFYGLMLAMYSAQLGVFSPRLAVILPHVGNRASSRLLAHCHLGRAKTPLCSYQVYPLYCCCLYIYSRIRFCTSILWRYIYFRYRILGNERISQSG